MRKPWQIDPNPVVRDGVTYITKSCPICLRSFRWAEEVCYECLETVKQPLTEEELEDALR